MERYIGLDVHLSSCTVAVVGPTGKRLGSQVVETNAAALVQVIRGIPGTRRLCTEEGTQSEWLCEVLSPHVHEFVVKGVDESRGSKSDKLDAFGVADELRRGAIRKKVYKNRGRFGQLRHLAKAYEVLVRDCTRAQVRLKMLFRSRGVEVNGSLYGVHDREEWLKRLPETARLRGGFLYREYDALDALKSEAQKELIREGRKHLEYRLLKTCPGIGPIRAAQLLAVVVTPYRFQNKRKFWSYCGLGIVMRSSSDWVRTQTGEWVRAEVRQTRGLARNFNHTLKDIFKGAATTVIGQAEDEPLYRHYVRLLDGGTKPNLAKLTIARQIASIVLSVWRNQEAYDPKRLEQVT
jgi:transposase